MKISRKVIFWVGGVIVAVIILSIFLMVTNQPNTRIRTKQNTQSSIKVVNPTGQWQGKQKYSQGGSVTLKVYFLSNNRYRLIETNTVSQYWIRDYSGIYRRSDKKMIFTPKQIKVSTYTSKQALVNKVVATSQEIPQSEFHKQFGNQQHSQLTLQHQQITIIHDHEKIGLHRI